MRFDWLIDFYDSIRFGLYDCMVRFAFGEEFFFYS